MKQFKEPENLAVFTCTHVMRGGDPILTISHEEDDGGWQFLCGNKEHRNKDAMIVALMEIVALDESVNEVADLPLGRRVKRETKNAKWDIMSQ
ncbi:MAG: hypothetical protein EPO24_13710 [Bacteroidetes bacterium]|nr:MAG: hypothetical protein EPO24_13710 [Bacteroidota bacterium]